MCDLYRRAWLEFSPLQSVGLLATVCRCKSYRTSCLAKFIIHFVALLQQPDQSILLMTQQLLAEFLIDSSKTNSCWHAGELAWLPKVVRFASLCSCCCSQRFVSMAIAQQPARLYSQRCAIKITLDSKPNHSRRKWIERIHSGHLQPAR